MELKMALGLIFELPTSCFGESLQWGVRRIAEFDVVWCLGYISMILTLFIKYGYRVSGGYNALIVIVLLVLIVHLIFSILLFVGATTNRPSYLRPYFWLRAVEVVIMMLGLIGATITSFFIVNIVPHMLLIFSADLVICLVGKYFCQVIYALIHEIESGHAHIDTRIGDV